MNYWEDKIQDRKDIEYFKSKLFTPLDFPKNYVEPIIDVNNLLGMKIWGLHGKKIHSTSSHTIGFPARINDYTP